MLWSCLKRDLAALPLQPFLLLVVGVEPKDQGDYSHRSGKLKTLQIADWTVFLNSMPADAAPKLRSDPQNSGYPGIAASNLQYTETPIDPPFQRDHCGSQVGKTPGYNRQWI